MPPDGVRTIQAQRLTSPISVRRAKFLKPSPVRCTSTSTTTSRDGAPVGMPMFAAGVRCHHRWICCGLVVADWKPWAVRGILAARDAGEDRDAGECEFQGRGGEVLSTRCVAEGCCRPGRGPGVRGVHGSTVDRGPYPNAYLFGLLTPCSRWGSSQRFPRSGGCSPISPEVSASRGQLRRCLTIEPGEG